MINDITKNNNSTITPSIYDIVSPRVRMDLVCVNQARQVSQRASTRYKRQRIHRIKVSFLSFSGHNKSYIFSIGEKTKVQRIVQQTDRHRLGQIDIIIFLPLRWSS